jgi:hypothetical protein
LTDFRDDGPNTTAYPHLAANEILSSASPGQKKAVQAKFDQEIVSSASTRSNLALSAITTSR